MADGGGPGSGGKDSGGPAGPGGKSSGGGKSSPMVAPGGKTGGGSAGANNPNPAAHPVTGTPLPTDTGAGKGRPSVSRPH